MTRSSYEVMDSLSSQVGQLVVRQPPSKPQIYKSEESAASGKMDCNTIIVYYLFHLLKNIIKPGKAFNKLNTQNNDVIYDESLL